MTYSDDPELTGVKSEETMRGKYLVFKIRDDNYGIEIRAVHEIIGIQKITHLPENPDYIKGVINLHGKVIPVVDVRLRLGFEDREYDDRTCIINVRINDKTVGLIVDSVSEVMDIADDNIEAAPVLNPATGSSHIDGLGKVGESVIILLNSQKLLYSEDFTSIIEDKEA